MPFASCYTAANHGGHRTRPESFLGLCLIAFFVTGAAFGQIDPPCTVRTVVGNPIVFGGDGGLATEATLLAPESVARHPDGSLYIADTGNSRIRRVGLDGIITTIAGTGEPAFSGDGGPATSAALDRPRSLAFDGEGNLYFVHYGVISGSGIRVRRISSEGVISTVAGNGEIGFSGDGGPATEARFSIITDIAVDANGNIYLADPENGHVRKVDRNGIIQTVAGGGSEIAADGVLATEAQLGVVSLAVDPAENLYIVDARQQQVFKLRADGVLELFAGNGQGGLASGDGGPATDAVLEYPLLVRTDAQGNVYILDRFVSRFVIRRVTPEGIIDTVSGRVGELSDFLVDEDGSFVIPVGAPRSGLVSRATPDRQYHILAGVRSPSYSNRGDGLLGTMAYTLFPRSLALDASGNLYINEFHRIRKLTPDGLIDTVAGGGEKALLGDADEIPARDAEVLARDIAVDADGDVLIVHLDFNTVWKLGSDGIMRRFMGGGPSVPPRIGDPAREVGFFGRLQVVEADNEGNVYVGENYHASWPAASALYRIDRDGIIQEISPVPWPASDFHDIAFNRNHGLYLVIDEGLRRAVDGPDLFRFEGGGGFGDPNISVDDMGNVHFSDRGSVWKLTPGGVRMEMIPNVYRRGFIFGEGEVSTSATVGWARAVALDTDGNLFVADSNMSRIRRIAGASQCEGILPEGTMLPMIGPALGAILNAARFTPDVAPGSR